MDSGSEGVSDPRDKTQLRRQAVVIVGQATLIAALMTVIASVSTAR